ncbi:MAG: redox-sensitive transcriptional activator SoxR [Pseudomonadota bacterium]
MVATPWISIGEVAARTGAAVSAVRFYEERGLIAAHRSEGGNRLFLRSDIRRISFILIAQKLGFTLEEIGAHLKKLPEGRAPTKKDWEKIARRLRADIDERIALMTLMRNRLTGCIGCGCLSLKACALYNPDDEIRRRGTGPRFLKGDEPRARKSSPD